MPQPTADDAALCAYLSLPTPRLVLDLRPPPLFAAAHIAHSTHIFPLHELRPRYSCLPPRTLPFLVLATLDQRHEARHRLNGCPAALFVFLRQHHHAPADPDSTDHTEAVIRADDFWPQIQALGLLRSCAPSEIRGRVESLDDWPQLLFRPSNAVRRLVQSDLFDQAQPADRSTATMRSVLDLGCGAGRDLAWILYGPAHRGTDGSRSANRWHGVGLDNWKAVLTRTELLMQDLKLMVGTDGSSGCQALVWAKCTDQGHLEPLVGSGKGRPAALPAQNDQEAAAWATFDRVGLSPLSSQAAHRASGPPSTPGEGGSMGTFDLVLSIRFYPSTLLARLRPLVRPDGAILVSHFTVVSEDERSELVQRTDGPFVIDYDSPGLEGRLGVRDADELVQRWNREEHEAATGCRWAVEQNFLEPIEDGRIVRSITLRRRRPPRAEW
ncbi:hypothetical protein ACQY0O_004192 [Thecaphora frezii]